LRRRPPSVNGAVHPLPLSGDHVTKRLSTWRRFLRPYFNSTFDLLTNAVEERADEKIFPVCSPCLALIVDVERVEFVFKSFCDLLWTRCERKPKEESLREEQPSSSGKNDNVRSSRRRAAVPPPGFYAEDPVDGAVNVDPLVDTILPKAEVKRELIEVKDVEAILRSSDSPRPVPPAVGSILISRRTENGSPTKTKRGLLINRGQQLRRNGSTTKPLAGRPPLLKRPPNATPGVGGTRQMGGAGGRPLLKRPPNAAGGDGSVKPSNGAAGASVVRPSNGTAGVGAVRKVMIAGRQVTLSFPKKKKPAGADNPGITVKVRR
jgi:hypothetical protein